MRDWTAGRLEKFIGQTANGGRGFNTRAFANWVNENQTALIDLLGPDVVRTWKAFPRWEARANFLRGLGQRFLEVKTGGLSRFFNKEIDMRFADGIAEMLTNPNSPLFQAVKTKEPVLPSPREMMVGGQVLNNAEVQQ